MGCPSQSDPASGTDSQGRSGRLARRRAWAVLFSVAVHVLAGFVLFKAKRLPRAPRPEAIEVAIGLDEPTSVAPLRQPSGAGRVSQGSHSFSAPGSSSPRRRPSSIQGEAGRLLAERADLHAPEVAALPPGTAPTQAGSGNRLSTLLPDHPDLSVGRHLGDQATNRRDPLAPPTTASKPAPTGPLPEILRGGAGVTADVAEDGAIRFHDAKNLGYDAKSWIGRFDITDAAMRKAGQDPYAAVKRKMADETREQRVCLAKQAQDKWQREALGGLPAKVKQIAGRLDLSALERRRMVFEIWDECSEGPGDSPVDYGSEARALILSAIREAFPEGGALAYQPGELLALNQRRSSSERFAPYERHAARARRSTGGAPGATSCP